LQIVGDPPYVTRISLRQLALARERIHVAFAFGNNQLSELKIINIEDFLSTLVSNSFL
jgi:hypothetical protein